MKARILTAYIFVFTVCSLLFFASAKSLAGGGEWSYKIEATKTLSFEERKQVWEIYSIRLTGLGIKKSDLAMAWDGNTIHVDISNPGKYGQIKEEITQALKAEGRLSFWETFNRAEFIGNLFSALREKNKQGQFVSMFDSTSFTNSSYEARNCLLGYVLDDQKNNFTRITDSLRAAKVLPPQLLFAFVSLPNEEHPGTTGVIALKSKSDGKAMLDNPRLTEVKTIENKHDFNVEISMRMDSVATVKWAVMTKQNTGRSIAVVIDGAALMYPTVNGEITGGVSSITGAFDKEKAERIVTLLKTGPLPCPMKMIEFNNGK